MKSFFKHSLGMVMVLSLTACSGSKSSQALNDFSYLDTAPLGEWQSMEGETLPTSNTYAIPRGEFSGVTGEQVNISPPVQLLQIIPNARYKSSPYQAIFMLPKGSELDLMNNIIRSLVQKEIIPLQERNEQGIATKWINVEAGKEGVQARYQLTALAQNNEHGIQVTLLEAQRARIPFTPTDAQRERYNLQMLNKLLLQFDIYMREQQNQATAAQDDAIPLELGSDRSGNTVIIARSSYNDFWDRLPDTLAPLGFSLEDRNRSQGMIEMNYSAPDDQIWQSLGVEPIQLDNARYQFQLGDLDNRTSINLLDNTGKPVSEESLTSLFTTLSAL